MTSQLDSQVSVDACPATPRSDYPAFGGRSTDSVNFFSGDVSHDALCASGRPTTGVHRSREVTSPTRSGVDARGMVNASMGRINPPTSIAVSNSSLSNVHKMARLQSSTEPDQVPSEVSEKLGSLSISGDSSYGSLSSSSSSSSYQSDISCSSLPSVNWEAEIAKYREQMPADIRTPYIDVLILYAEEDRAGAERFKNHLISEIKIKTNGPVQALLYDCEELTSLYGLKIGHLEKAVERSTYVFMYLTKQFVNDTWMEFSSESCLMTAIYDPDKRWCVVPVYTEKRSSSFKIPMGLNSLKGINYYNNDEFYRRGVARLIGDKVHVRVSKNETLKIRQKKWIEECKRKNAIVRENQHRIELIEERKTADLIQWLRSETERLVRTGQIPSLSHSMSESQLSDELPSLKHSLSSQSLKPITSPNPAVQNYFQDLLHKYRMGSHVPYGDEHLAIIQQVYGTDDHATPLQQTTGAGGHVANPQHHGSGEAYQQLHSPLPHGQLQRASSQTSTVQGDNGSGLSNVQIPDELERKLKGVDEKEQEKWKQKFREQQQQQMLHQSNPTMAPNQSTLRPGMVPNQNAPNLAILANQNASTQQQYPFPNTAPQLYQNLQQAPYQNPQYMTQHYQPYMPQQVSQFQMQPNQQYVPQPNPQMQQLPVQFPNAASAMQPAQPNTGPPQLSGYPGSTEGSTEQKNSMAVGRSSESNAVRSENLNDPFSGVPDLTNSLENQSRGNADSRTSSQSQPYGNNILSAELNEAAGMPKLSMLVAESYNPDSRNPSESTYSTSETSSSGGEYTSSQQGSVKGQSVDGPKSSIQMHGNMPTGLFNSFSLEHDCGRSVQGHPDPSVRSSVLHTEQGSGNRVQVNVEEGQEGRNDASDKEIEPKSRKKKEKSKFVHYTINVYSAGTVQVGDSNLAQKFPGIPGADEMSDPEEDEEEEGIHQTTGKQADEIIPKSSNKRSRSSSPAARLGLQDDSKLPLLKGDNSDGAESRGEMRDHVEASGVSYNMDAALSSVGGQLTQIQTEIQHTMPKCMPDDSKKLESRDKEIITTNTLPSGMEKILRREGDSNFQQVDEHQKSSSMHKVVLPVGAPQSGSRPVHTVVPLQQKELKTDEETCLKSVVSSEQTAVKTPVGSADPDQTNLKSVISTSETSAQGHDRLVSKPVYQRGFGGAGLQSLTDKCFYKNTFEEEVLQSTESELESLSTSDDAHGTRRVAVPLGADPLSQEHIPDSHSFQPQTAAFTPHSNNDVEVDCAEASGFECVSASGIPRTPGHARSRTGNKSKECIIS